MIISRTPFRISFLGGGTDLPSFYNEEEGAVISTTIDKYMYITINDRFDESYRLSYSQTEICENIGEIQHPIFKRVLELYGKEAFEKSIGRGLEMISMADIPSGTGLGSSSSFTVGLLHAMKAHLGLYPKAEDLAAEASKIEIEDLGEPIGKQDQYAAAYGGMRFIRFLPTGEVSVDPVVFRARQKRELESSIMMFYTGMRRSASEVLSDQKAKTSKGQNREALRAMRDLAYDLRKTLEEDKPISRFGELLHEGWEIKKTVAKGVSLPQIDDWYSRARDAGAWGGKILGAGGGGFLLLLAPADKRDKIKKELSELRPIDVGMDSWGSKVIFVG